MSNKIPPITDLPARLRWLYMTRFQRDCERAAADEIEAQQREIAKLTADVAHLQHTLKRKNETVRKRAVRAEAERDAARNAALEEAEQVCARLMSHRMSSEWSRGTMDCANAIRKLIEKESSDE